MDNTRKSIAPFEISYEFKSFIPAAGDIKNVAISGKSASWENGLITVTENKTSINPSIYSSLKDGNDRSQPLKKIDSSEYFPLATLTVTNKDAGDKILQNIDGLGLNSQIKVLIKGQNIEVVPLNANRTSIGFDDFPEYKENDKNKDAVVFQGLLNPYQNLQIKNPTTGKLEESPFYFGYVGAVEGGPKSITKDQLLVGNKNKANLDDGETKTYTLYGRLFGVDANFDPIVITSITEDTGIKGDFRTSDNTLIFNGTAEPRSKVEVFIENKSIGIAYANNQGNWLHNYSQVPLPDGQYTLTAAETNLFGEIKTTSQQLEIDTRYNITPDFTDSSIANNQKLKDQINKAIAYWEGIILDDIPDVKDIAVGDPNRGGLIDDLKIKFRVVDFKDGKGETLARTNTIPKGSQAQNSNEYIRLRPQSYLPYHTVIEIDSADVSDIIGTNYGLQTLKHEIAHAIGFNSETFNKKGLIKDIGNYRYGFTGSKALIAYHEMGGKVTHSSVPLEDDDKRTPSHWNEWLFPDKEGETYLLYSFRGNDELMTPENSPGQNAILSKLTLEAFKDLGFRVDDKKSGSISVFTGDSHPIFGPFDNPLFAINY